ncbi:PilN domain-containing protein [Geobacter sp. SVR]|uniref:PilN domain-containing protein n=1 Tax=Geobacter sp. SVR TaxID=2495594 RepID=UPI00143EF85F|nr:PilN domain-containing protein [Geobacter sp. SVR]BCS53489.1 fimbrial protein [Geobacter sp. SVR]GCF85384.1 fimbrial protein [Geobacter sp. SVR]
MIRINLLPVRAARKKETAVQQVALFCMSLILVLAIVLAMYMIKRAQIASTHQEIAAATVRIKELKAKIGKLEALKNLKEQVRKKLDVLAQLRRNKSGPAHRLATLSDITPDQLWLTAYSESGADIKLSGLALNEDLIATFMRSLDASSDYTGVELVVSEQSEAGGTKLKRFDITCKLRLPEPAKVQDPAPAAVPKT